MTDRPAGAVVPGQLTFTAPRRGKPPQHLADLTVAQRREAAASLGVPTFRAGQVGRHYFEHLTTDPAQMTDLPAAGRAPAAAADPRPNVVGRSRLNGEVGVAVA